MENPQKSNHAVVDELATKKNEAEDFINTFEGQTKLLMQWYHGCTTNFIREVQSLMDESDDKEVFAENIADFLGLEVDRNNVIIPFWEECDSDHDDNINSDNTPTPSPLDLLAYIESHNVKSELYHKLINEHMKTHLELMSLLSVSRDILTMLYKEVKTSIDYGNQES